MGWDETSDTRGQTIQEAMLSDYGLSLATTRGNVPSDKIFDFKETKFICKNNVSKV